MMEATAQGGVVLITGAAGLLGRHVVEDALARGFAVRATDLPGRDLEWAARKGASVAFADLSIPEQVAPLVEGVSRVGHLAAVHNLAWPLDRLMRANRDTAALVTKACARAGVKHLVYCSSADTYGSHTALPVGEESAQHPENNYAISKLAAERLVIEISEREGLPVTVLRPTVIYGPWCTYAAGMFCALPLILHRRLGRLPRLEGGPLVNAVHVEDAAGAVVHALGHDEMAGRCYNVADDQWLSFGEFYRYLAEPLGVEWSNVRIPLSRVAMSWITRALDLLPAGAFERTSRWMQSEWDSIVASRDLVPALRPTFDKGFLSYGRGDHVYDNARLEATGYKLRWPDFVEGYRETVRWYRERRWIPESARSL